MRRKLAAGAAATVAALGIGIPSVLAATSAPAVPSPGIAYGCVVGANRTFQDVYQSETNYQNFLASNGGNCPSGGFKEVVGYAPPSTPAPAPTSTTPAPTPTPTSPTTPPVSGTWSCTTTALKGECPANGQGYKDYAGFSDFADQYTYNSPYVDANVWAGNSGQTQETDANSPGNWQVQENIPAGSNPSGSVTTYPNAGFSLNGNPALTAYSAITSSFADTVPGASGNSGWQGYDLWYNNWGDEEMIQTQFVGNSPCTYVAVQQFQEPGTSTQQTWGLCNFGGPGGEKVWKLAPAGTQAGGSATVNETSGSVDVMAMTDWLISHGDMLTSTPAATSITSLSAGFEICQTSGTSTWAYSSLTFNATKAS